VQDGEYLLKKNNVTIDKKAPGVKRLPFSSDDMYSLIQQQPNTMFLGVAKAGLWVNSFTSKGKKTKFKTWLNKNLGHEPVIFQDNQIQRTIDQMSLFLNNNGFFNSQISTEISRKGKILTPADSAQSR